MVHVAQPTMPRETPFKPLLSGPYQMHLQTKDSAHKAINQRGCGKIAFEIMLQSLNKDEFSFSDRELD